MSMYSSRKISMQKIADALSISKNSVSIALNDKPGVSQKLREKVLQAAISMNYAGYGDLQKPVTTQTILVSGPEYVFKDLGFYHRILGGIEQQSKACRFHVLISSISDEMQAFGQMPAALSDLAVTGILLVGTLHERYVRAILELGKPTVSLDQIYDTLSLDAVVTGNTEGARTAVRHLLATGHRRIGYVGPRGLTSSFRDRWEGYTSALRAAGLSVDTDICVTTSFTSLSTFQTFQGLAAELGRVERLPTAFFCANDSIAINVMHWLAEAGKRVPQDISIVGFDDAENVEHLSPPLTTMTVHRETMGRKAIELLLSRIRDAAQPVTHIVLQADLTVRDSSRSN
jgi:DNA-binding LacI/PurR family transcriptional regulator